MMLICNSQIIITASNAWAEWNKFAENNIQYVASIPRPAIPMGFSRYYDPTNATYQSRENQFRYINNFTSAGPCNIYCGPHSFPYMDNMNNIIC